MCEIYIQPKCNVDSYDSLDDDLLPDVGTCDLPILRPTIGLSAPPETCAHSTCNIDATDEGLSPMRTRKGTNWFSIYWAVLRSSAHVLFSRLRYFFKMMFKSSNLRAAMDTVQHYYEMAGRHLGSSGMDSMPLQDVEGEFQVWPYVSNPPY